MRRGGKWSWPEELRKDGVAMQERIEELEAELGEVSEWQRTPPGLLREHGYNHMELPLLTKVVTRHLMVEGGGSHSKFAHDLSLYFLLLMGRPARKEELFSHCNLPLWCKALCAYDKQLHAADILRRFVDDGMQLHVGHDGTGREDAEWGLGHLMQYLGSQYDMQKGKAELHMIGCRFITGASGMDTAVNMMRCLSEMLLCEIEEVTATEVKHNWSVTMVQGCEELLGSAPSDNTISAVQVAEHLNTLLVLPASSSHIVAKWGCFHHVIGLLGKNPTVKMCGDPGRNFDEPSMLNLCNKQW